MEKELDEKVVDKEKSNFSSLSTGIVLINFLLFLILLCSFGAESVRNSSLSKLSVVIEKEYTLNPALYCSEKGILYFNASYTPVLDENGKVTNCNKKNTIYEINADYESGYKIIKEKHK